MHGHKACARLLISHGADTRARSHAGQTALEMLTQALTAPGGGADTVGRERQQAEEG